MVSSTPPKLIFLQAARGIAAMMVVAFHAYGYSVRFRAWPRFEAFRLFEGGFLGVQLFFVLSGIVILSAHWRDIDQSSKFGSFCWKRFRRVYPVYWIVLGVTLAHHLKDAGDGPKTKPLAIFSNVILVHVLSNVNIVDVSWTLYHEILFYGFFALLLFSKRIGSVVLLLWFGASLLPDKAFIEQYSSQFLLPDHLLFAFGMVVAWLLRRDRVPAYRLMLGAGVLIFLTTVVAVPTLGIPAPLRLASGFGAALLLLGGSAWERAGGLRVPRWLAFLGDASYSIYLVHIAVISALVKTVAKHLQDLPFPEPACIATLFCAGVAVGCLFHISIEKPLLRLLERVKKSGAGPRSSGGSSAQGI